MKYIDPEDLTLFREKLYLRNGQSSAAAINMNGITVVPEGLINDIKGKALPFTTAAVSLLLILISI